MAESNFQTYFINPEYRARNEAATRESKPGTYWTPARIENASFYLTSVYRRAARLLASRPAKHRHVADVGCGYPIKSKMFLEPVADSIVGFDQPTLTKVVTRHFPDFNFREIDLESPPPKIYEQFDLVVCCDVVEHLLDPDRAIEFLVAITKPDGLIVISTPEREVLRGKSCLESPKLEHVREWTMREFGAYLRSRGINILDHRLCPEHELHPIERVMAALFHKLNRTRRWAGCQLVVGQPRKR